MAEVSEATQKELDRARLRRDEEQAKQEQAVARTSEVSEKIREQFDKSDQGAVHRQIDEAERLMRGPNPVPGSVVGDPSKGPSS